MRLLGLALELVGLLLSWLTWSSTRLRLVATSATPRRTFGEQVELALVAVVEGLARVLGPVERLVGLGPEDQADALPHAHGPRLWEDVKVATPTVGWPRSRPPTRQEAATLFRRTKPDTAPEPVESSTDPAVQKKGRPTPSRKEAEAAAKARAKVPRTRKEMAAAPQGEPQPSRAPRCVRPCAPATTATCPPATRARCATSSATTSTAGSR